MFETGKLYKIKECFWVVFPTLEKVGEGAIRCLRELPEPEIPSFEDYWSFQLGCPINVLVPGSVVCCVENHSSYDVDNKLWEFVKVIAPNGAFGWISVWDIQDNFEELKEE